MSVVIYEGPSRINGKPIVVVATGFKDSPGGRSANEKTGPMIQCWILAQNEHPSKAVYSGEDEAICGGCPLRAIFDGVRIKRKCYVRMEGPSKVWVKWKEGGYPKMTAYRAAVKAAGERIRMGAYGDPAAVPLKVWKDFLRLASGWTGYSHQWDREKLPQAWKGLLMASCDNENEYRQAIAEGWRTFRTGTAPLQGEILCPASIEAGKRTTCFKCNLCDGSREGDRRKNIFIPPHGTGKKHFQAA